MMNPKQRLIRALADTIACLVHVDDPEEAAQIAATRLRALTLQVSDLTVMVADTSGNLARKHHRVLRALDCLRGEEPR